MNLRFLMAGGLAGMLLVAACAHKQPAKVAPAAPPVVTKPAPAPAPVPVIAAAPAAGAGVATTPSFVPDYNHAGDPLPDNVIAWDSLLKSQDVTNGLDVVKFSFSFTNITTGPVTVISVHPSCGCTTAELPPTPWLLPAGTSGEIKLNVNIQGKIGTLFKYVTVTTDKGTKNLNLRINILPEPAHVMTDADLENGIAAAKVDRQAVFKSDCASCHNKNLNGKYAQQLFAAACTICHEAEHRATMVPDLRHLKVPTNPDFWRVWITSGKPGSLMPAFSKAQGGPLDDIQIASLAQYLNAIYPSTVPLPPAAK